MRSLSPRTAAVAALTGARFAYSGTNAPPAAFTLNGTGCDTGADPTDPPTTPPPDGPAPELRVSGNRFVDSGGNTVRLLGVNRSGGEFACVQGSGIWDGPMDAPSVAAIKSWNVNAVRVPLNSDCWLGLDNVDPAYRGTAYRNAVKNYVALLEENGITPILELHWSHGTWTGYDSHCETADADCQKPMPDAEHAPEFWRQVATAYKTDTAVVFDLFNEPYPNNLQVMDYGQWLARKPSDPTGNLAAAWHSYDFNYCKDSARRPRTARACATTCRPSPDLPEAAHPNQMEESG
ncbi:cellulase family glycosylhydrolase [Actinomadura welshii]|uniref:cellulase family glycosylhydrolase n=1 Tax=Actinomadura welshii TaxID=3103817 RepID=UPI0003AD6B5C|nr:cellulase family glycosylhydrolase [Actinomadura madurae]